MTWRHAASSAALLSCGIAVMAAQGSGDGSKADPRVGLKPGLRDAGQAIRNLDLVASLPKPAGFFDPAKPIGDPTPAEEPDDPKRPPRPFNPATANRLDFGNSDKAFDGHHLFDG